MHARLTLMLLASAGVHAGVLSLDDSALAPAAGVAAPRTVAVSLVAALPREVLAALEPQPATAVAAEQVTPVTPSLIEVAPVAEVATVSPSAAPAVRIRVAPATEPPARVVRAAPVLESPGARSAPPSSAPALEPVSAVAAAAPAEASPAHAGGAREPDREAIPVAGNPPPRYPWTARMHGVQGQVVLRVWVSEAGDAARLDVLRSSGSRLLDEAALAAVGEWRFEPARRNGRSADSLLHVPVRFRLEDGG